MPGNVEIDGSPPGEGGEVEELTAVGAAKAMVEGSEFSNSFDEVRAAAQVILDGGDVGWREELVEVKEEVRELRCRFESFLEALASDGGEASSGGGGNSPPGQMYG